MTPSPWLFVFLLFEVFEHALRLKDCCVLAVCVFMRVSLKICILEVLYNFFYICNKIELVQCLMCGWEEGCGRAG